MSDKKAKKTGREEKPRTVSDAAEKPQPKEIGGRNGPEPTRYGDWEKNGIISDF